MTAPFRIITKPYLLIRCRKCGHRARGTIELIKMAGLDINDDLERIAARLFCRKCRAKDFEIKRADRYEARRFVDRH